MSAPPDAADHTSVRGQPTMPIDRILICLCESGAARWSPEHRRRVGLATRAMSGRPASNQLASASLLHHTGSGSLRLGQRCGTARPTAAGPLAEGAVAYSHRECNPFLRPEKLRPLAGHGADPFPTVDIAQVELYDSIGPSISPRASSLPNTAETSSLGKIFSAVRSRS